MICFIECGGEMSDQSAQIKEEIIRLRHEWTDAIGRRDRAALDRILSDDFLIAGWLPEGRVADKKFYLEDCLMPVAFEQASFSYDRWEFRLYHRVVVANCLFKCRALINGQEWGGTFLITDVWADEGGFWKVVMCHSSAVQNSSP
jgi:hypothetical protein